MTLARDYLAADALYRAAITTNARHGPISQPPRRRNWTALIIALAFVTTLIAIIGGKL